MIHRVVNTCWTRLKNMALGAAGGAESNEFAGAIRGEPLGTIPPELTIISTMQRTEPDGIVISCDFTGIDWDEEIPMIEGHRGSIICLDALVKAVDGASEVTEEVECTMCRRKKQPPERMWQPTESHENANPAAAICWDCIQQADRSFSRDPDTEWERKIPPDENWS